MYYDEDEDSLVYTEKYLIFNLLENEYVKYRGRMYEIEYTSKAYKAERFDSYEEAVNEAKKYQLELFKIEKIYVGEE